MHIPVCIYYMHMCTCSYIYYISYTIHTLHHILYILSYISYTTGIAASVYGATHADGVDIDIDSLISANWNCEHNRLNLGLFLASDDDVDSDEEMSIARNIFKGQKATTTNYNDNNNNNNDNSYSSGNKFKSIDQLPQAYYNITIANILAPILIQLAPMLSLYTISNGYIAMSGVLSTQAERVISVYSEHGFMNMRVEEEADGWVLISGVKKF